jgi:hypothetical protein
MSSKKDVTLTDINRRELNFIDHNIEQILPDFFRTEYPKLISLLTEYYEFEKSDDSPANLIHELFYSRDITQTDIGLLSYIEDELLLGQSYFEGFKDKRAAAKYSNQLYRSKGTKFSIEQFFRTFFGVDPSIEYTKDQVFKVGEVGSEIGFNSLKYLTNDKLYQTFAVLIKTDISQSEWIEPYKLFAHPAGMFVGSEVQIMSVVEDTVTTPQVLIEPPPPLAIHSAAGFGDQGVTDLTSIVDDLYTDSDGVYNRIRPELISLEKLSITSMSEINEQYSSLREAQTAGSPTFDDSDEVGTNGMDLSNNFAFETLDQQKHQWWSADSDQYVKGLILDNT